MIFYISFFKLYKLIYKIILQFSFLLHLFFGILPYRRVIPSSHLITYAVKFYINIESCIFILFYNTVLTLVISHFASVLVDGVAFKLIVLLITCSIF